MDAQYVDPATKFAVLRANWETVSDALRPAQDRPRPRQVAGIGMASIKLQGRADIYGGAI